MDVERLRLIDESASVGRQVYDGFLRDLPHSFVDRLQLGRDGGDVLDRAACGNDEVLHVIVPKTEIDQVAKEPRADDLEIA